MIMRTDIPEPWKCVGGHDPAVVVHDLPRHSCKSIQKVQKGLFSVLTVAFILHALDSWARRINVVLPSHKHHRHPLRKERCHWNCYHGIKHCAFLLRRESCYEGNAHAVPVLLSFHHEKQSNRGIAKKTLQHWPGCQKWTGNEGEKQSCPPAEFSSCPSSWWSSYHPEGIHQSWACIYIFM